MKKIKNYKPRHKKATGRKFNGRKAIDALYHDGRWKPYRDRYLAVNKKCYACGTKSNVVDHLVPHKGDKKLFEQLDNHIPLCDRCHNTVTTLFDRHYKIGTTIDRKLRWINGQRIRNGLEFKVKVLPYYTLIKNQDI